MLAGGEELLQGLEETNGTKSALVFIRFIARHPAMTTTVLTDLI
jgi:hypothetical protein